MSDAPLTPLSTRVPVDETVEPPASVAGVTWRAATLADAPALLALSHAAGLADGDTHLTPLEEIEQDLVREGIDLTRDSQIGIDANGRPVAFGVVLEVGERESIARVIIEGAVLPERRREGIGAALLRWQDARARQRLAEVQQPLPGWILSYSASTGTSKIDLFTTNGFETVRWWNELHRPLDEDADPIGERALDPSVRLEVYGPQWAESTRLARNVVFRDHWGSQPTTAAEWAATDALSVARPDLSYLAVAPGADGADEVVAFVLTQVDDDEGARLGRPFAYISYVGVKREWRGRGIAQSLIGTALRAFRDAGFAYAALDVDSDSPTGADGLYAALGFRSEAQTVSLLRAF